MLLISGFLTHFRFGIVIYKFINCDLSQTFFTYQLDKRVKN